MNATKQNRNLNIPNILAGFRILLSPVLLVFLVYRDIDIFGLWHESWFDYLAGLVFVVASVTDFFDGYIARQFDQMTTLGAILDPLADKMLILAGFLGLVYIGRADVFAIFLILSREFFITGLRVVAVSQNKNIASTISGKVKTVVQMFAIGFLIMNWPYGTALLWLAVFFTLYSGYEYIKDFVKI
ncbi:MAG: CDP-diacylglycerol--glycerol-3-phosphate 3-phosphatidyltransferase [Epsilonproteobacteria bacterium]|nr:MAG: CDP-diacylglycerol--glycerol-3-phosphate 3-phosphatidyltransferase [Campylobacterota bacterium]